MGILDTPPTRPRTYGVGTDIEPNDLNDLNDFAIAIRSAKKIPYSWTNGLTGLLGTFDISGPEFAGAYIRATAPGDTAVVLIDRQLPGEKLTGVKLWVYGDGANNIDLEILKCGALDAARASIATHTIVAPAATWTAVTWALGADAFTIAEGDNIQLIATGAAANLRIRSTMYALITPT